MVGTLVAVAVIPCACIVVGRQGAVAADSGRVVGTTQVMGCSF